MNHFLCLLCLFVAYSVLAGEQLCLSAHPRDPRPVEYLRFFPAHCLPLEPQPISLLARQESGL
jgi:hypothetical protein